MNKFRLSINTTKNLLAFSAGVDSSALFFLLVEQNIPFDIAIVNYNQRESSNNEVIYATQLAHKYGKKCFISLYPKDKKFSEKTARDYRHNFFEEIIEKENYEALLTAHQLNDKLEWFLIPL
jgi:tRNA(Ile)-lysidine synthase